MKNEIRGAALGVLTAIAFYLVGAFVFSGFDISTWPEDGRMLDGVVGGFFSAVVYAHTTGKIGA